MILSKNVMRNVARFQIGGRHGLKCETGLYGRNPNRSAHACNLCVNRDIRYEKIFYFSCMGTIYGTSLVQSFI